MFALIDEAGLRATDVTIDTLRVASDLEPGIVGRVAGRVPDGVLGALRGRDPHDGLPPRGVTPGPRCPAAHRIEYLSATQVWEDGCSHHEHSRAEPAGASPRSRVPHWRWVPPGRRPHGPCRRVAANPRDRLPRHSGTAPRCRVPTAADTAEAGASAMAAAATNLTYTTVEPCHRVATTRGAEDPLGFGGGYSLSPSLACGLPTDGSVRGDHGQRDLGQRGRHGLRPLVGLRPDHDGAGSDRPELQQQAGVVERGAALHLCGVPRSRSTSGSPRPPRPTSSSTSSGTSADSAPPGGRVRGPRAVRVRGPPDCSGAAGDRQRGEGQPAGPPRPHVDRGEVAEHVTHAVDGEPPVVVRLVVVREAHRGHE